MPTYTYQCDSCGHGFEAVQRFADDPLSECPQCRASIRRVIQPVGVVFKGSGWYITDSRPKSSGEGGDEPSQGSGLADGVAGADGAHASLPLDPRAPRLWARRPLLLSLGARSALQIAAAPGSRD